MTKTTRKNILVRLLLIVGFVIILVIFLAWQKTRTSQAIVNGLREAANSENISGTENIIANAWNWNGFSDEQIINGAKPISRYGKNENNLEAESEYEFDVVLIYAALGLVEIEDNGDVVIDKKALRALKDTVAAFTTELSIADVEQLKKLIKLGLPGKSGEQTAQLVADFYFYSQAKMRYESAQAIPENIQEASLQYELLKTLREHYFGLEVSEALFGNGEELTRYTLSNVEDQENGSSNDRKKAKAEATEQ